ncbi:hypothetical protein [Hymenobacter roseosalivarius]|uniref:hypothetical protein n=1 Tax=Hymenobacter roseosalivarius TaxID=89967 RepID=UPI00373FD591
MGSGLENHGKYGELIYAHNKEDLFVNLFIPSRLTWPESGLTLTQETHFPYAETTSMKLQLKKACRFSLHIRQPNWLKPNARQVLVNGRAVEYNTSAPGYLTIKRKWKSGDVVSMALPMETKAEFLPDKSPRLNHKIQAAKGVKQEKPMERYIPAISTGKGLLIQ